MKDLFISKVVFPNPNANQLIFDVKTYLTHLENTTRQMQANTATCRIRLI